MKKQGKSHHVVANPNGGWDVKRANSAKASSNHSTKAEAVSVARQVSINQKTELVVHNRDGRIAQKDSHGGDKFPPRG